MTVRKRITAAAVIFVITTTLAVLFVSDNARDWLVARATGGRTVGDAVRDYGDSARAELKPAFESFGVSYPPSEVVVAAVKDAKTLEVWAANHDDDYHLIKRYPIVAASGHAGPKLREGDRQVPEGVYRIVGLNPNSAYHLSMRLDYPNDFDRAQAAADGRTDLGGDIFIHGSNRSIGCLAVGDRAIEELFVLVVDTGTEAVKVVIAPSDPREGDLVPSMKDAPSWLPVLYERITDEFSWLNEPGRS